MDAEVVRRGARVQPLARAIARARSGALSQPIYDEISEAA
jgi:hypothetical protein